VETASRVIGVARGLVARDHDTGDHDTGDHDTAYRVAAARALRPVIGGVTLDWRRCGVWTTARATRMPAMPHRIVTAAALLAAALLAAALLATASLALPACAPKHVPPPPSQTAPETARAEALLEIITDRLDEAGMTAVTQAREDLIRATEAASARLTDAATERDMERARSASLRLADEIVARAENVDTVRVTRLIVAGSLAGLSPLWPYTEQPDVGIVPLPPADGE